MTNHTNIGRQVIGWNGRRHSGVVVAERSKVRRGRERRIVSIRCADGDHDVDGRFVDFDWDWSAPVTWEEASAQIHYDGGNL